MGGQKVLVNVHMCTHSKSLNDWMIDPFNFEIYNVAQYCFCMFEVFPNRYSESVFLKVLCNFIDPNEHLKWDKLQ